MSHRLVLTLLFAPLFTASCAGVQTRVPLSGAPDDRAALVGHWEGEFESAAAPRNGIIDLDLASPGDTAEAVVVLIPHTPDRPPDGVDQAGARRRPPPEILEFARIDVRGDEIRAELKPYPDPFGEGSIRTTLRGRLDGDRITGTWTAESDRTGDRTTGRWTLRRIASD